MSVSAFDPLVHHSQTNLVKIYQKLSQQSTITLIESLRSFGIPAIVSFNLGHVGDSINDGEITFGFVLVLHYTHRNMIYFFLSSGVDPAKFDINTLIYLPNVSKDGFWESNLDAVSVDGRDLNQDGRTVIFDTGGLSASSFLPKSIK